MHSQRNKGKQGQREVERKADRGLAVASLATSPEHLRDCAVASRTRSLLLSDIPVAWQGQPLRSFERLATGETFTVGENKTLTVIDLERSEVTERTKDFDRVVHLRGISGRTFNLMIGATKDESPFPEDERAYGCVTHSPNDGERYKEKMLIRTRKGRKLVQRPNKQRSIELESAFQLEQAGVELDAVRVAFGEYRETSERIPIDLPVRATAYQVQGATLAQLENANPSDSDLTEARAVALNREAAIVIHPLEVPRRADSEIPSRRQIDDRSTRR